MAANSPFDLPVVTAKLRATAPQWQPNHADRAAESLDGRSGPVRTDTDFSSIETLPPEKSLRTSRNRNRHLADLLWSQTLFAG